MTYCYEVLAEKQGSFLINPPNDSGEFDTVQREQVKSLRTEKR